MGTYKIKSIVKNMLTIEYRTNNGTLKEFSIFVEGNWDKQTIERQIALTKLSEDRREYQIDPAQYFSKGEVLEFIDIPSEKEASKQRLDELDLHLEEHKRIENEQFLDKILQYRNIEANYSQVRWYEYPSIEEQLDAMYWMRQGILEPIQEIDRKITEVKEKYKKGEHTNLTLGDLDDMFPNDRPTLYKEELKYRNIQADFLN